MRNVARSLASAAILASAAHMLPAQRPDSAMLGAWSGTAHISAPWILTRELPVRVQILEDGRVTGSVGDARLVDARLAGGRSVVGAMLRVGRVWEIAGRLSGPIISAEAQVRARVRLSLDWTGSTFTGDVQTSGTYEGTPADLVISATGLVLQRAANVSVGTTPFTTPRAVPGAASPR